MPLNGTIVHSIETRKVFLPVRSVFGTYPFIRAHHHGPNRAKPLECRFFTISLFRKRKYLSLTYSMEKIEGLLKEHADDITVFGYHDPSEFPE